MNIIKYNEILEKKNLETIREIITNNGVIIYPTDTLYGLGGNFLSLQTIKKIDTIKQRTDMPYSAIIPNIEMLKQLVHHIPDVFYELHRSLLPGKFTLLFNVSPHLNPALVKGSDKIGIRIPNTPHILELLEILSIPLITTSVNLTGKPALNNPQSIYETFSQSVDLLIDAGILEESKGSTILDITQTPIRRIRNGDDAHLFEKLEIPYI